MNATAQELWETYRDAYATHATARDDRERVDVGLAAVVAEVERRALLTTDTAEAALDEARNRIEALEREAEILREALESLEARRLSDELDEAYAVIAGYREGRRVLSEQVEDLAQQNLELRKRLLTADCRAAVAT